MVARSQSGFEALQAFGAQTGAHARERRVALLDRREPRGFEVVVGVLAEEGRQHRERGRRVLDPRSERGIAHALGPPAVLAQEVVEVLPPLGHVGISRRAEGPDGVGTGEHLLDRGAARRGGQRPERAVGLHDPRVRALEELRDVGLVDTELDARGSEGEVVADQRVHELEVDLPHPTVERPELAEVDREVGQRHRLEVGTFEVSERGLDVLEPGCPQRGERHDRGADEVVDPARAMHDLPRAVARQVTHVPVHSAHPRRLPLRRRQLVHVGAVLGAPQHVVRRGHAHRREAATPMSFEQPEPILVVGVKSSKPSSICGWRGSGSVAPGYHSSVTCSPSGNRAMPSPSSGLVAGD